jgi:CHASE2 domain-containing sensor protein
MRVPRTARTRRSPTAPVSAALAVIVYGVAMAAWWLVIIGFVLGALALSGWVFEYYRGEHAH